MPRRARISRTSGALNLQSAVALRAISARVHRGRINPVHGVRACVPSAGGRSRAPWRARAASPRSPSDPRASRSTRSTYTVASTPVPVAGIDERRAERRRHRPATPFAPIAPAGPSARRGRAATVQRPPLDVEHVSHVTSRSAGRSVCAAVSSADRSAGLRHVRVVVDPHVQRPPRDLGAPSAPRHSITSVTPIAIDPRNPRIGPSLCRAAQPPVERHCRVRPRVPQCTGR